MKFVCKFCSNTFVQKINLQRHLNEHRCKSPLITDLYKLNEYLIQQDEKIQQLSKQLTINGNNNVVSNSNNDINMKIEININPITKLNIEYIEPEKMKQFIESYDADGLTVNPEKLNMLLGDYIKGMICNDQHPENHAVKYTKKKPPTYNSITEDSKGNTISVIKGLKDTCELLSDPILNQLKLKMKEFIDKYKSDNDPNFDYSLYEDAINQLKIELNKKNVKKALSSVLQNDILSNIEMKLTCFVSEKRQI